MNYTQFNNVLYRRNINADFYLYCLKSNFKLIKYLFLNLFYFLISFLFVSKKDIYNKNKFRYLKEVKELDKKLTQFSKKNKLNDYYNFDYDVIIDNVPVIFIKKFVKGKKIIGYEFDSNFNVKISDYNNMINTVTDCKKFYRRNIFSFRTIKAKSNYFVFNKMIKYYNKENVLELLLKIFLFFVLTFIVTKFSFLYTNYIVDPEMIESYSATNLFFINYFIVLFFFVLFFLISKRIHVSWLIVSFFVLALGVANQTKLLYRDDIVKFEDFSLLKEAGIMTERYAIVFRWYTIVILFMILFMFFLLRKIYNKLSIKVYKQLVAIIICIIIGFCSYKKIYRNENIYDSIGDKTLVNNWIITRTYQIRGLLYPFVYTFEDGFIKPPENYNKKEAEKVIDSYTYKDIDDDKKVNIVAIMLEAYNDFSKFEVIDFNEDIYAPLHKIQSNSISGNLVTNIFGGGTVNTERSFLTGYYNFPTFRKETNSYVWYFKEQGYNAEAFHPIYGAFYNRGTVDINLGFNYYYNYENTFSKIKEDFFMDDDFYDYIIKKYNDNKETKTPYFSFSVTYQNHGPYNGETYEGKNYYFDNNGKYDEEAYNTINEYLNGIKSATLSLEKLINYFDSESEPVIVIFFGDHNPYIGDNGFSELGVNMDLGTVEGFLNYYETPYVIHANESAKKVFDKSFVGEGNKISPIFLMNELFEYCELEGNQYLQYTTDLKKHVDVLNRYYYKEDGVFVKSSDSNYKKEIDEYNNVNYYVANNRLKRTS